VHAHVRLCAGDLVEEADAVRVRLEGVHRPAGPHELGHPGREQPALGAGVHHHVAIHHELVDERQAGVALEAPVRPHEPRVPWAEVR
jgi:hypothetical protein